MPKQIALTTIDNPYNPITDFMNWFLFDVSKGYNTCELVDRICYESLELTDEENLQERERAFDEFIAIDPMNFYKKVVENVD